MSIHCGASFGGGQGYTDTCGKEVYGKGTPLAQCAGCMKEEIFQIKAENESLRQKLDLQEMLGTPEQFLAAKDAERYRSMFRSGGWDYSDEWYDLPKSEVDALIDANRSPENPS